MSGFLGPMEMAPTGSTGNNTHAGVGCSPGATREAAVLVIEAVGATPTISIKLQATLDPPNISDASAKWFDVAFMLPASGAIAAPVEQSVVMVQTAIGAFPMYLSQRHTRFARRLRVVTSANTNVTYRAEYHAQHG